jgi:hypothetical protein
MTRFRTCRLLANLLLAKRQSKTPPKEVEGRTNITREQLPEVVYRLIEVDHYIARKVLVVR